MSNAIKLITTSMVLANMAYAQFGGGGGSLRGGMLGGLGTGMGGTGSIGGTVGDSTGSGTESLSEGIGSNLALGGGGGMIGMGGSIGSSASPLNTNRPKNTLGGIGTPISNPTSTAGTTQQGSVPNNNPQPDMNGGPTTTGEGAAVEEQPDIPPAVEEQPDVPPAVKEQPDIPSVGETPDTAATEQQPDVPPVKEEPDTPESTEQPNTSGGSSGMGGAFPGFGGFGGGSFPNMGTGGGFPTMDNNDENPEEEEVEEDSSGFEQQELTTETYGLVVSSQPFRTAGSVPNFDLCFDKEAWCDEVYAYAEEYFQSYPFPEDYPFFGHVFSGFVRDVYCSAASQALSFYDFFFAADGEFSLGREGKADKLSEIKLSTHTKQASILLTQSMAEAEVQSGSKSVAYAFSSIDCGSLALFPQMWRVCQMAYGGQESVAMAAAKSNTTAFSEAMGASSQGSNVYAYGRNIDRFEAVMATSASNFAVSQSTAFTEAWSSAISIALNQACLYVCQQEYNSGSFPSCGDACLTAQAIVTQISGSFAEAMGLALASLELSLYFFAAYQDQPGTSNDLIAFGLNGYVNGQIEASCKKQTASGSDGGGMANAFGSFGN